MEIFNINDYKKKSDINLDELDDRYINADGDVIDNLYIKNMRLNDTSSAITFFDDTVQTTAFNSQVVSDMINNNITSVLNTNNTFLETNTFNKDVSFKKQLKVYDLNGLDFASLIYQNPSTTLNIDAPYTNGNVSFWVAGKKMMNINNTQLSLLNNADLTNVKKIIFTDGTQQTTAITNSLITSLQTDISSNTDRILALELTPTDTIQQNATSELFEFDDFVNNILIRVGQSATSKFNWVNLGNNSNNVITTNASERGHSGIITLQLPSTLGYASNRTLLQMSNTVMWEDISECVIIFKVPSGLSSYNKIRLWFGLGAFSNATIPNGAYIQSDNNAPWTWCVNSSTFGNAVAPHNNWRIGNWNQLTITNTGNGNCKFEMASPENPLNKNLISFYHYTGGALTGLVSPVAGIWESASGNNFPKNVFVDYISIKYLANRRN